MNQQLLPANLPLITTFYSTQLNSQLAAPSHNANQCLFDNFGIHPTPFHEEISSKTCKILHLETRMLQIMKITDDMQTGLINSLKPRQNGHRRHCLTMVFIWNVNLLNIASWRWLWECQMTINRHNYKFYTTWCQLGDIPLSIPMMTTFTTYVDAYMHMICHPPSMR